MEQATVDVFKAAMGRHALSRVGARFTHYGGVSSELYLDAAQHDELVHHSTLFWSGKWME